MATDGPDGALGRRQFLHGVTTAGLAAGAAGLLAACSASPAAVPHVVSVARRRGGDLKIGLTGSSTADTLDPHNGLTRLDAARAQALYSPLAQFNSQAQPYLALAESFEPRGPSDWVIRLKRGITFHDGQELTAADVIYTFRRIIRGNFSGAAALGPVKPAGLRALDRRTILVPMTRPYNSFFQQLQTFSHYLSIVPAGFDPKKPGATPNGTGPYRFGSFTPGQRSVFTRNPDYWKPGLPYADTLTIIGFPSADAMRKALVSNVIQAAAPLDADQVTALRGHPGVRVVVSYTGSMVPFTMRVDEPPFNDVRVRQAMRLLLDRPQLVSSALGGYGRVASDVFAPIDEDFDHSLHREQDLSHARFLLKQAGQQDLTVQLVTSPVATGTVAMATELARQAKAAGVTVKLRHLSPGQFYGPSYLRSAFSQDFYGTSPYLPQVALSTWVKSPFNETHQADARYNRLYVEANRVTGLERRKEILHEMQEFDFSRGGYIIPAFVDSLDAYSTTITGYSAAHVGQPLANYDFENFSFTG